MKKFLGVLLIVVLMAIPMSAFAAPFTTESMDVDASGLTVHLKDSNNVSRYWYGDYDLKSNPLGGINEVFCVEDATMIGSNTQYDFYYINDLSADIKYNGLVEATWYANWFVTGTSTEERKLAAQLAIWNVMGVATYDYGADTAASLANSIMSDYDSANDASAYVNNWALAVSPSGEPLNWGVDGQNYLVQNPVPEPTTMLLFGTGLLGLAGIRRRKKK